jgi:hypothetical protein
MPISLHTHSFESFHGVAEIALYLFLHDIDNICTLRSNSKRMLVFASFLAEPKATEWCREMGLPYGKPSHFIYGESEVFDFFPPQQYISQCYIGVGYVSPYDKGSS